MALLGDKVECKKLAKKAKVPTVPGRDGAVDDEKVALRIAQEIEYPVIIKAAAGGGGRGMRVAHNDVSLRAGLKQAKAEAENAFKDSTVYIEKYVEFGRHVEVQIMADSHGNACHLWNATARCSAVTRSWSKNLPHPFSSRTFAKRCAKLPCD
jgi:acetyl-CoA carboxylase biotin carboxylase subunit